MVEEFGQMLIRTSEPLYFPFLTQPVTSLLITLALTICKFCGFRLVIYGCLLIKPLHQPSPGTPLQNGFGYLVTLKKF